MERSFDKEGLTERAREGISRQRVLDELNRRRVVDQKKKREKVRKARASDKIFIGVKVTSRKTGGRKLNISEVIKLSFENFTRGKSA